MSRNENPQGDINKMLIEFGDAIEHNRAVEILKKVKKQEAKKDLVRVRVDAQTILLMDRKKAIKKGYITE